MEKVEIINAMIAELKRRGLIQKQKDISERMNTAPSVVSCAVHGHPNGCTQSFIFKLNEAYGSLFNPEWLISGSGHMLQADAEAANNAPPTIHQQNAEHCTAVVENGGSGDAMALRLLQIEVENLRKDNARLEEEKKRLESRCDELQRAILDQLARRETNQ